MNTDDRVSYVQAVCAEFEKLFGERIHGFSSAECDLARKWAISGIPLATVLQALRETGGKPKTLHACERAVNENNARRAQAVHPGGPFISNEPHPLLEPLSMKDWDPAKERERLFKKYGRG